MGKAYLYGTLVVMLIAATLWAVRLRKAKEGEVLPSIKATAAFIAAGVIYPAVCLVNNGFALSGFVHHEGFVVIAAMMALPLIGVAGGTAAILIALFCKKMGTRVPEKVE